MSKAPAAVEADASLDEHAWRIIAANQKFGGDFCEWIGIVGRELKAAQDAMAGRREGFVAWAKAELGWSCSRVYQIIAAADVVAALSTSVESRTALPSNEAQCRALATLPKRHWRRVWTEATESAEKAGREVTAALIHKHRPCGVVAKAERSPPDPDRLLRRLDSAVREIVLRHPDRLADAVATLSSLIEFCQRPHVIAAMADTTPKASLDTCPTIRADRTPLVLDHVPAEPVAAAS